VPEPPAGAAPWYLLIHQLPPKPLYLRARIRQRLARVGAVALKNSVYVLPATPESLEDCQWIAEEAVAGGGEAWVCAADFRGRPGNAEIEERFRRERAADYATIAEQLRKLLRERRRPGAVATPEDELSSRLRRLVKRLAEVTAIDFFAAPGRAEAEALAGRLEERLRAAGGSRAPGGAPAGGARSGAAGELTGRVWVTRKGVHADRIASAWLIRRFVDPAARFRFADSQSPEAAPGELRFDTVGGELTHEGDRCTFETLVARLGLRDPAVAQIAEIVHDIDLKDAKFGRADAPGILQLVNGLALAHPDDLDRLDRGFALFDDLYESFRRQPSEPRRSGKAAGDPAPPQPAVRSAAGPARAPTLAAGGKARRGKRSGRPE
jgi:hypothetical protein